MIVIETHTCTAAQEEMVQNFLFQLRFVGTFKGISLNKYDRLRQAENLRRDVHLMKIQYALHVIATCTCAEPRQQGKT